jgi:hypothetical protein
VPGSWEQGDNTLVFKKGGNFVGRLRNDRLEGLQTMELILIYIKVSYCRIS